MLRKEPASRKRLLIRLNEEVKLPLKTLEKVKLKMIP